MHDVISVKHDRTLGLAPIFRPLGRGERSESKLDVSVSGDNEQMRITCFEPLGTDDQILYFTIISLCTNEDRGRILSVEPQTESGKILRNDLFVRKSSQSDSIMIEASEYELLKLCDKTDGGLNYEGLREMLARLASVNLRIKNRFEDYVVRLLAYHVDKETGKVRIAVNTKSANAILGSQYVYINLADHLKLNYEPAQILHGWLSSWMPQGTTRRIGILKLVLHVYPTYEQVSDISRRNYRSRTKKAALLLNDLGWKVTATGRGNDLMFTVSRPKIKALP